MICPFRSIDPRCMATECEGDYCMFWCNEAQDCGIAAFLKQQVIAKIKKEERLDETFGF